MTELKTTTNANIFEKAETDVYVCFSGHSGRNARWHLDVVSPPEGNTLEWFADLFLKNRSHNNTYLYLILDCCHAGEWCDKLKELGNERKFLNIRIAAACQEETYDNSGFLQTLLLADKSANHKVSNNKLTEEGACYYFPEIMPEKRPLTVEIIEKIRETMLG